MMINLYTDAPYHNLALMKLSAHHKALGDEVCLNMSIMPCDKSYASILFEKNIKMFNADEYGGPAIDESCLYLDCKPDYSLFPVINYSLGYTFRPCFRNCPFCKVWRMNHPDTRHHSIWEFHDTRFKYICLLNNNTFFDKQWRETLQEIIDAKISIIDQNGYDLRLVDEEKVDYLRRVHFVGKIHYAWDRIEDETAILNGLKIAPKGTVYVLVGYDTTKEQDIYRVQKIVDYGFDPYIMPFHQTRQEKRFKRFVDSFMWRKYKTISEAWKEYKP
jgi:hypothetical protein